MVAELQSCFEIALGVLQQVLYDVEIDCLVAHSASLDPIRRRLLQEQSEQATVLRQR